MGRSRLPPLNAIKAFEAAARLGSFTRAAEELNVTHGAVSRQVRLLEDWLGARLFLRTSRNAVPTQVGTDLLAEAGPALDRLAAVSQRLRKPMPAATLASGIGFADFRNALADPATSRIPARSSRFGIADRYGQHPGRAISHGRRRRNLGTGAALRLGWKMLSR
jgi:DNA-binding transcriptional LysR family regulator